VPIATLPTGTSARTATAQRSAPPTLASSTAAPGTPGSSSVTGSRAAA